MDVHISHELPASAEEIWHVIGERFDDLSWAPGITSTTMEGELGVGAVRECRFPPNAFSKPGRVCERLLAFDRETRTLTYEAIDAPGIMKRAVNRWTVFAVSPNRCRLEMHARVELRGVARVLAPLVGLFMRRMVARTLDQLSEHVAALRGRAAA